MCFFWKYHFLAQFSYGKHIIFKKGVTDVHALNVGPFMSPVHCTIVIFASFFLTDQFKSNFKIADQDLFYNTMTVDGPEIPFFVSDFKYRRLFMYFSHIYLFAISFNPRFKCFRAWVFKQNQNETSLLAAWCLFNLTNLKLIRLDFQHFYLF